MKKELFEKTSQEIIDVAKGYVIENFPHKTDIEQLNCYKHIESFIEGYHYTKKTMYSEEEVLKQLNHLIKTPASKLDKYTDDGEMLTMRWFEQFKKK
jgi:hypothetical protein